MKQISADHGANRLGASALMQGLADGYFVIPYTSEIIWLMKFEQSNIPTDHPAFAEAEKAVADRINTVDEY